MKMIVQNVVVETLKTLTGIVMDRTTINNFSFVLSSLYLIYIFDTQL